MTAHVPGVNVERHRFTSALPTQALRALEPVLAPMIRGEPSIPIAADDARGGGERRSGKSQVSTADSGPVKERTRTRGASSKSKRRTETRASKRRAPRVVDELF